METLPRVPPTFPRPLRAHGGPGGGEESRAGGRGRGGGQGGRGGARSGGEARRRRGAGGGKRRGQDRPKAPRDRRPVRPGPRSHVSETSAGAAARVDAPHDGALRLPVPARGRCCPTPPRRGEMRSIALPPHTPTPQLRGPCTGHPLIFPQKRGTGFLDGTV